MSISGAASFRLAMIAEYKKFEALLEADQEVLATFIMPTREIRMRIGSIGSSDAGILNVCGEDLTGSPVDIYMYYTQLCYFLEAASAERPRRIGFSLGD